MGGGIGNIKDDPNFIDYVNGDFHLSDNSPCIDAGTTDTSYNDGCRLPGKRSARNDMGAYGGPQNCGWLVPIILQAQLRDYLIGKINLSSDEMKLADFNRDGIVDIADLIYSINNPLSARK